LAYVLKKNGDIPHAIEHYKAAIEINPQFAVAYFNLGNAYFQMNQLDDALATFQKAIDVKPGYAKAYANMAVACAAKHQYENAVEFSKKAIELATEQGQTDLAAQIQNWLDSHRSELLNSKQ
jgi:tetratricopeptide (TPR) repeat protein